MRCRCGIEWARGVVWNGECNVEDVIWNAEGDGVQ